VLNKPAGLVVHPAPGHHSGTLVHGLLHHCRDLSGIGGVLRPGIVHRLDKDTSGLMIIAKNDRAHASLARQFKEGRVEKRYLALVHGLFDRDQGEIDLPIARHSKKRKEMTVASEGRRALTYWQVKENFHSEFTLLSLRLGTGRTHQIRVHLSHTGHPVVGDPVYGPGKAWWKKRPYSKIAHRLQVRRQMLHANNLGLLHPVKDQYVVFNAPLPQDMAGVLHTLKSLNSLSSWN
jgi:23S rRNA pseudouridine1911/1915/1917 synthase